MKQSFKILMISVLMTGFLSSCIMCRKPVQEEKTDRTEQYGFGDEMGSVIEQPNDNIDDVQPKVSNRLPAAERMQQDGVISLAAGVKQSTKKSIKRKESKVVRPDRKKRSGIQRNKSESKTSFRDLRKKKKKGGWALSADILLIILAIFLPWLSVGIYTSWDVKLTVLTLILWLLGWLPGVIFGMLVLFDVVG